MNRAAIIGPSVSETQADTAIEAVENSLPFVDL